MVEFVVLNYYFFIFFYFLFFLFIFFVYFFVFFACCSLVSDGFVSFSELKAMLLSHDEKYNDEEIHAMIHLCDPSNSGMISYQSFVRLMLSPED